jgi:hypothetical protein
VRLQTRQTAVDLAARLYEVERGRRPNSAADLVPDYLPYVPGDPVSGAPAIAITPPATQPQTPLAP